MSEMPTIQPEEWRAKIQLEFDLLDRRTRMIKSCHEGPLRVQRPFYPAKKQADECQVYLLHPPGGFVGNDHLEIEGTLAAGTHVLITTPSAGKFYRVLPGYRQRQRVAWSIKSGASLAWVPQENIFFRGCCTNLRTLFRLEHDAHLFAWDIAVLGRRASGERFDAGSVRQDFTLIQDDRLLLKERFVLDAGAPLQHAPWGMENNAVFATAILCGPKFEQLFERIQLLVSNWNRSDAVSTGVTHKNGVIIIRYLGAKISRCKNSFEQLKASLGRKDGEQGEPNWTRPRIWNT